MRETVESRTETVYHMFSTYMEDIIAYEKERYRPLNEKMQQSIQALEQAGVPHINLESQIGIKVILPDPEDLLNLAAYVAEWEHAHPIRAFFCRPLGKELMKHESAYEQYRDRNILDMNLFEQILRDSVQDFIDNYDAEAPGAWYICPLVNSSKAFGNMACKFYGAWYRKDVVKSLPRYDKLFVVDTLEHKFRIDDYIARTLHLMTLRIACEEDAEEKNKAISERSFEGVRRELDKDILIPCCEEAEPIILPETDPDKKTSEP